MKLFNQAWCGQSQLGQSLDLIDSYPITTSRGLLDRAGLGEEIMRQGRMLSENGGPATQRFEILDSGHALCMEKWSTTEGSGTLNRWTFLVKRASAWKVERLLCGAEDQVAGTQ